MKKKTIKEAWKLYKDWEKRKSWDSDFTGPHTTQTEDELARILFLFLIDED